MSSDPTMKGPRGLATRAFYYSGASGLVRRLFASGGRFALNLHGVSSRRLEDLPRRLQPALTKEELESLMSWVRRRSPFLAVETFLDSTDPGVLLTFDDGFANNATNVVPLLETFEAPAVFFVTTQHVARPHDWLPSERAKVAACAHPDETIPADYARDFYDGISKVQLQQCAAHPLVTIGSHTVTHPFLTTCSDERLRFELSESRRYLEEVIGGPVEFFAYPSDDYDLRVAMAVSGSGYQAAFAVESQHLGVSRFEIPRIGIYGTNPAYLGSKLSGWHRRPSRTSLLVD